MLKLFDKKSIFFLFKADFDYQYYDFEVTSVATSEPTITTPKTTAIEKKAEIEILEKIWSSTKAGDIEKTITDILTSSMSIKEIIFETKQTESMQTQKVIQNEFSSNELTTYSTITTKNYRKSRKIEKGIKKIKNKSTAITQIEINQAQEDGGIKNPGISVNQVNKSTVQNEKNSKLKTFVTSNINYMIMIFLCTIIILLTVFIIYIKYKNNSSNSSEENENNNLMSLENMNFSLSNYSEMGFD